MSWIVYENSSNRDINKVFLSVDPTYGSLSYNKNPALATTFKTKKEAQSFVSKYVWKAENTLYSNKLDLMKQEFQDWVNSGMVYRTIPVKNEYFDAVYDGENAEDTLQWLKDSTDFKILEGDGILNHEKLRTWPPLSEKFSFLHSIELYMIDGVSKKTVILSVNKNSSFKDFEAELDMVKGWVDYKNIETDALIFPLYYSGNRPYDERVLLVNKNHTYSMQSGGGSGTTHTFNDLQSFFAKWTSNHFRQNG